MSTLKPYAKTRRSLMTGLTIAMLSAVLAACGEEPSKAEDTAKDVTAEEILKSGTDLPDLVMGSPEAKVTVVEYASLTCGHCMNFHTTVFPEVKKKYIDTGMIRFIFRDFPLDPRAFGGSMLARCLGGDKALALIDTLFHQQAQWAHVASNPKQALFDVVKQAGFTEESFDKCLTDQKLFEQLTTMQKYAGDTYGVHATPSIFIDGKKIPAPTLEQFDKALEPLLGSN